MLGWGVSNKDWISAYQVIGYEQEKIGYWLTLGAVTWNEQVIYCQTLSATFRFAQRRPFSKGLCFLCSIAAQEPFFIYVFDCRYGYKSYQYSLNIPRLWLWIGICWQGSLEIGVLWGHDYLFNMRVFLYRENLCNLGLNLLVDKI